jgi:transposase
VHRLPAYAPELNPVEGVWSWFKGTVAANLCPEGLAPICRQLGKGRRRLRHRPDPFHGREASGGIAPLAVLAARLGVTVRER